MKKKYSSFLTLALLQIFSVTFVQATYDDQLQNEIEKKADEALLKEYNYGRTKGKGDPNQQNVITAKSGSCDQKSAENKQYCDLHNAFLKRLRAKKGSFKKACFRGADLKDADLKDADFEDADCEDADFRDADLRDANFTGANIKGANFEGALVNSSTNLPGKKFPAHSWGKLLAKLVYQCENSSCSKVLFNSEFYAQNS